MTGGTIVCGVDRSRGARDALQLAGALSERLGLRLVVAHVAEDAECASSGEDLLSELAHGAAVREPLERRVAIGDRALRLAEVASEEGADVIVIGSPSDRWRKRRRAGALERELESATSCPVVIAPRQTRRRSDLRLASAPAIGAR